MWPQENLGLKIFGNPTDLDGNVGNRYFVGNHFECHEI